MKYGMVDNDTKNSRKNTFDISDTYLDKELEDIMYKKLLEENIPEDVDISNNNFIASATELKASTKDRCLL
jgi:c-di-GMP-binding flagellar brake protein YcgR